MAIYAKCTKCRKDNPKNITKCNKYSTKLGSKYHVKVKDAQTGKWSTQV